jgi:protocatechuate 3,4-dioxygenase beta subunit
VASTRAATADADGNLRVRGLAAGLYDLRARRGNLAGALHFELKRTTDLGTLRLSAAVAIAGHVYGPRGGPVPGARVEACRAAEGAGFDVMTAVRGMSQPEEVVARATADADGAYVLMVPEGTYALRANASGFAQEGEAARLYATDTDGIDFWLLPGALLQGRVLDARQSPVAAAHVLVVDPMGLFGRRVPKAETATGADGTFSMVVTPTQQSMLIVRAAGYASHMQPNLRLPQTNLVIVLEEGVALRLQAVDAERPEIPAPHVNVVASYKGGFAAGETDDLGRLLIENLPTRSTGMGGQQQLFLWGGGFIAQTVDLGRQEPVDGVLDLGTVKIAPGGVVRGRVLDKTTGDPIAQARVRTFGGLDPQLEFFGTVTVLSARDGSFKVTGVPLGASMLMATHPDFLDDVDPMTLFSGMQRGGAGGPPLFPEGSRDVERNIEMTPAESVTGTVLAPDGSPVAGADVAEVGDESRIFQRLLGGGSVAATSDESGAFVLKGVRPGREISIAATHRDYGPSEDARVRAGEPVALRLAEPLAIKGFVVDEAGAAIAGVRVQATRAMSRSPQAPFDSGSARPSITDEEGRFLIRNAPLGELTVTFDHPDYAIATVQTTKSDLGRTVLPRGGTIEGEAVDGEGKPVVGVTVHAWSQSFEGGGRRNANAVTDETGRFAMRGLAEGEYQLRTWDPNYYSQEPKVRTGASDVRIVLHAAAKLNGRVTGRGLPVAGASVRAQRGDDFLGWGRTGADGTFVMSSLPPDEPFDVTIEHDAFRSLRAEAVRVSDRTQDFVMQPGTEVSGRVVDPQGRGVQGAQVQVRVGGKHAKSVQTDATGGFTAGGLDEGPISVQLGESNQGFIPTEWTDVAAGAREVRLVATPGESISGTVRDREGKPVRQVSLQALDANGQVVASTWVWQEDGNFELRGLRPGTYTVRAQRFAQTAPGAPAQQPAPREVTGVGAGTKGVEIRLE